MLVPVARAGRTPATDFTVLASLVGGLLVWLVLASYALGRSHRLAVLHLQRDVAQYVAGTLDRNATGGATPSDTALSRLLRDAGLVVAPATNDTQDVLVTVSGSSVPLVIRAVDAPGTGLAPGRRELLQLCVAVGLAATCLLGALLLLRLHRQHEETTTRSDFVRVVSHELRTPLSQILMFAETLRLGRTRSEDDRRFALDAILQEARRLARLVDNVLRFTRLEQSGMTLPGEPVDIAAELREVASQFTLAGAHGTLDAQVAPTLHLHADGALAAVADRDALRQVLVNLIDNAIRHGGNAGAVELHATRVQDQVEITVQDSGPGIPRDDLERVWLPFSRGHHSTRSDTGTGLGLTIVRGLTQAMSGTVRHETPPGGRGARFVVTLPAATSFIEASDAHTRHAAPEALA